MALFDNLGKKVGNFAQTAAKKSSELVETTKINYNINSEEDKIKDLFCEIGKSLYAKFSENQIQGGDYAEQFAAIAQHEANIKNLREKIYEIKNIVVCPSCGSEVERTNTFCNKCGAKIQVVQTEAPPKAANQETEKKCPNCSEKIDDNTVFCSNCGTKVK
jgi:DNA-directed RNA polymerase subunit RPC12/RpoP